MNDINQSMVIDRVVKRVGDDDLGLLGLVFKKTTVQKTKKIATDIDESIPKIAPIMSDKEEGVVLEESATETHILDAAFTRLERTVDLDKVMVRQPGQKIGQNYDNTKICKKNIIRDLKTSIRTRQKLMAAQALFLGKMDALHEDKDKSTVKNIDFKRNPELSEVIQATDEKWSNLDANIPKQITQWAAKVRKVSGVSPNVLILDAEAASYFEDNNVVEKKLNSRRGSESKVETACNTIGNLQHIGKIGTVEVIVYAERYEDAEGNSHPMLPANSAILLDIDKAQGVLHFGALKDKNQVIAKDFFVRETYNSKTGEEDVSVESRYLPIVHRINATFAATVA
tara:strand:- start:6824 stop:7846 length:1023 start_codon:yes stop_codon:yes gene_type:complete